MRQTRPICLNLLPFDAVPYLLYFPGGTWHRGFAYPLNQHLILAQGLRQLACVEVE